MLFACQAQRAGSCHIQLQGFGWQYGKARRAHLPYKRYGMECLSYYILTIHMPANKVCYLNSRSSSSSATITYPLHLYTHIIFFSFMNNRTIIKNIISAIKPSSGFIASLACTIILPADIFPVILYLLFAHAEYATQIKDVPTAVNENIRDANCV